MGGHGGLNILPQKKWNVYNFDNREKVRKDEEAAAKEEQIKREQSRKRDSELRLDILRRKSNLDPEIKPDSAPPPEAQEKKSDSESKHINLFEGIKILDPVMVGEKKRGRGRDKELEREKRKMMKKEEEVRVVGPEDEKYRLGYGVVGKGVKAPWYAMKREVFEVGEERERKGVGEKKGKKSVEELREERLKREKVEKERERALLLRKNGGQGRIRREQERSQWRYTS